MAPIFPKQSVRHGASHSVQHPHIPVWKSREWEHYSCIFALLPNAFALELEDSVAFAESNRPEILLLSHQQNRRDFDDVSDMAIQERWIFPQWWLQWKLFDFQAVAHRSDLDSFLQDGLNIIGSVGTHAHKLPHTTWSSLEMVPVTWTCNYSLHVAPIFLETICETWGESQCSAPVWKSRKWEHSSCIFALLPNAFALELEDSVAFAESNMPEILLRSYEQNRCDFNDVSDMVIQERWIFPQWWLQWKLFDFQAVAHPSDLDSFLQDALNIIGSVGTHAHKLPHTTWSSLEMVPVTWTPANYTIQLEAVWRWCLWPEPATIFLHVAPFFFGINLWDLGRVTVFSTVWKSRKWELRKIWIPRCAKIVLKYLTWSYDGSSKSFRSEATRVQHRHTPGWKGRNWAHGTGVTSEMWALPRVSGCIFRLEIGNWCPPNTLIFLPYHIIDGRNRAQEMSFLKVFQDFKQGHISFISSIHCKSPARSLPWSPYPLALVQSFFHRNSTCGFYFTSSAFLILRDPEGMDKRQIPDFNGVLLLENSPKWTGWMEAWWRSFSFCLSIYHSWFRWEYRWVN